MSWNVDLQRARNLIRLESPGELPPCGFDLVRDVDVVGAHIARKDASRCIEPGGAQVAGHGVARLFYVEVGDVAFHGAGGEIASHLGAEILEEVGDGALGGASGSGNHDAPHFSAHCIFDPLLLGVQGVVTAGDLVGGVQLHGYGEFFDRGYAGVGGTQSLDGQFHVYFFALSASPGIAELYGFHPQESVDVSRGTGSDDYVAVLVFQLGQSTGEELAEIGADSQGLGAGITVVKNGENLVLESDDFRSGLGPLLGYMLFFCQVGEKEGESPHHTGSDDGTGDGKTFGARQRKTFKS